MKIKLSLLFLLLTCQYSFAQLKIIGNSSYEPYKIVKLQPSDTSGAVIWDVFPEDSADIDESDPNNLRFTAPPGTYKVKLRVIKDNKAQTARKTIVIGLPGPGPIPIPPGPVAKTDLKILTLYDNKNIGNYPSDQRELMYEDDSRTLLREKCTKTNGTADFRFYDFKAENNPNLPKEKQFWKDLLDKYKDKPLPYIVICNDQGTVVFDGPFPANLTDLTSLINKYGK